MGIAQLFSALRKSGPTVNAVHAPTALGNDKPKRGARTFREISTRYIQKRDLQPNDAETAKSPFPYDPNALGSLRPDQVPRFFGALTDREHLPDADVNLSDLHAMQDRVDTDKVEAIRGKPDRSKNGKKKPVVVQHNGRQYIADGHHRLAADWLDGEDKANVKFLDLEPVSNALKRGGDDSAVRQYAKITKIDDELGLVFGWAIVCKVKGEDYYDLNVDQSGVHKGKSVPEHITESAMTKAAAEFMETARPGNELHEGPDKGSYIFAFPLTTEIAKAMNIQTEKTGLMVAYKPPADVLAKFRDGTYSGFSIEGKRVHAVEHDE